MPEAWRRPSNRRSSTSRFRSLHHHDNPRLVGLLRVSRFLQSSSVTSFSPPPTSQCPPKAVIPPARNRPARSRARGTISLSLLRSNASSTDFLSSPFLPMTFLNARGRPAVVTVSLSLQIQQEPAEVDLHSTRNVSSGRYVITPASFVSVARWLLTRYRLFVLGLLELCRDRI